jgi:hypothetical protein
MTRTPVRVTAHAKKRAAERFPEMKLARVSDEVREALAKNRFSTSRPGTLSAPVDKAHAYTTYAWTEDGERIYALHATTKDWVVITTMKAGRD